MDFIESFRQASFREIDAQEWGRLIVAACPRFLTFPAIDEATGGGLTSGELHLLEVEDDATEILFLAALSSQNWLIRDKVNIIRPQDMARGASDLPGEKARCVAAWLRRKSSELLVNGKLNLIVTKEATDPVTWFYGQPMAAGRGGRASHYYAHAVIRGRCVPGAGFEFRLKKNCVGGKGGPHVTCHARWGTICPHQINPPA